MSLRVRPSAPRPHTRSSASAGGGVERGEKLVAFRFHRRKNVRVKRGHRQHYTSVRIQEIRG